MKPRAPAALAASVLLLAAAGALLAEPRVEDAGAPFGPLPLVDEVDCGVPPAGRAFEESKETPSRVETLLGRPCRVLPPEGPAKYFAYRVGQGKGLKEGAAYLLVLEYPEDRARSMFIMNRGGEMQRGFRTGEALGDVLYTFTINNNESLRAPLSGQYGAWRQFFYLNRRFAGVNLPRGDGARPFGPKDGFDVVVAQAEARCDPASAGAAVARIRLFEVPDPARFDVPLRRPPAELPQRHVIFREEMAEGAVKSKNPDEWATDGARPWFEAKMRLMAFLGMDTYGRHLLEFGHNQGWPCGENDQWYNRSRWPDRWERILALVAEKFPSFSVMPYYEYCGSVGRQGLGTQKRCKPLSGGEAYTHIKWSEKANADLTDPATLEDFTKVLDATLVPFKDKVRLLGAWIRPRPSHMPISFSDRCLDLFAKEANGGKAVTREELRANAALHDRYCAWWFGKRKEFLVAVRDHLRKSVGPAAQVLFTADSSEPGRSLKGGRYVVTDDPPAWEKIAAAPEHEGKLKVYPFADVVGGDRHLEAQTSPVETWGSWEWQHSAPQADPQNYRGVDGVLMTCTVGNAYTASAPRLFDAFRGPSGLAAVRHYALNEGVMPKELGYVACEVDRAGPLSVLTQVRAVAHGDPNWLGYLEASSLNHGFPEHLRAFHAAFLALPALPSAVVTNACAAKEVVVRAIATPRHGTWLAVANVGFAPQTNALVRLPSKGKVTNAATGEAVPLSADGAAVALDLGPCQLVSLHVAP
jgi:hypothetical protein